ncbi:MAG: 2-oxoglutarate and iron-dependent oxygenase domain-containing protein [Myxococcota bacterium]
MTQQTIPVVNLEDFKNGNNAQRQGFARAVGEALEDTGFFAVTHHGVDPELIRRAYQQAEAFFALPDEKKLHYEDVKLKGQRGYTSFGREHAKDHPAPDLKEFWHVGQELPPGHRLLPVYGPNLWPAELPEFQPVMLKLFAQLEASAKQLLRACALHLGESEQSFSEMVDDGDTILRVIHYPPIPPGVHPAAVRAAAHEDINLITLLCESTAEGLELLQRDGRWRPIHALQGQIVVDAGDMMQHLTNGVFKSTTHRVTNPSNDRERRFSMPFFVHPRAEVDITPRPGCVARTGGTAKYPRRTARQYLEERLREIGLA